MVQVTLLRRTLLNPDVLVAISKSIQAIKLLEQNPPVLSCACRITLVDLVTAIINGCVFQNFDLSSPENGEETSTDAASS